MSKLFNIFLILTLSACSWLGTNQVGDVPEDIRVKAVKVGKHNKDDVVRLLGSATSITLFEKESWLYIESKEQNRVFFPAKEIERKVIQITFNSNGIVEKVNTLSLEDGQEIALEKSITPVSGKDLSVVDELIGNFGRFPANKRSER